MEFFRKNIFLAVFLLVLLALAGYYLWLNRIPYTTNAFVVANVRPVAALVPGPVTRIHVVNNQDVKRGQPLFTVYKRPYELAVQKTGHALTAVECEIKALQEEIKKNRHRIEQQSAKYAYAKYRAEIEEPLVAQDFVPEVRMDELLQLAEVDAAGVKMARATLQASIQRLEQARARKKSLEAELEMNEVRLEQTTVYARGDGIVCNMFMSVGTVADEQMELFAFVDTSKWWVQANLKETVLTDVRPGMKARIVFPLYPEHTFHGTVEQIGWGVNRQLRAGNALPVVEKENEWFLLPQRFPVQIAIDDPDPDLPLHVGLSANVHIETGHWQLPRIR